MTVGAGKNRRKKTGDGDTVPGRMKAGRDAIGKDDGAGICWSCVSRNKSISGKIAATKIPFRNPRSRFSSALQRGFFFTRASWGSVSKF